MSGLEVAGVLLGTFPLILSGLEHYRDVAKVAGFWWQIRKKYQKCRDDVRFHEIVYRRNLKELLLPIVLDTEDVNRLVADPGGERWTDPDLQGRLEHRLQESYSLYMGIISEMNERADDLRKELAFDKDAVQSKLPADTKKDKQPQSTKAPKSSSVKSSLDYQKFRMKFSLGESAREGLLNDLKECNDRLEKLLSTSDKMSSLSDSLKRSSALENALSKACKKSELLFRALHKAWQCSCQQYHYANLRLEHRTLPEICFEVILVFVAPHSEGSTPWTWKELQCGEMISCSSPKRLSLAPSPGIGTLTTTPVKPNVKKVAFSTTAQHVPMIHVEPLADPRIELCQLLGCEDCGDCMGVIGHGEDAYHLHPSLKRKQPQDNEPLTLDRMLSYDFEGILSRRQRYYIALLLASSVAQLQFTPWLRIGLTKEDVLFFSREDDVSAIPYGEPFIRQGFESFRHVQGNEDADECNFYSLGILLLELCFGQRLEDHPLRKKHPAGDENSKQAFDLMAALKWSQSVADEGGSDYATAVKWCFMGASSPDINKSWRTEIITNVVRPLELCQKHFETTNAAV